MKIKKSEMLGVVSTFLELVVAGNSIESISDQMGYDISDLSLLHKRLLEMKTEELQSKPVEHVYVEYMLEQLKSIYTLNDLIEKFDGNSRNLSAAVAAVRLRSDIHDRLLEKGQECGIFRKVPERKEEIHGLIIADLTADDLRNAVVKQYSKLAGMTRRNETMEQIPFPTNLHYGPKIVIEEEGEDDEDEIKPKKKATLKKKKKRPKTEGD